MNIINVINKREKSKFSLILQELFYIYSSSLIRFVVNAKALSIMRYQDDINTEHNMKSIGRAAVAQWTKRLTRNGYTRVRISEAHNFNITLFLLITDC